MAINYLRPKDRDFPCTSCHKKKIEIVMEGYAEGLARVALCKTCATQLARKLLEDICEMEGDRHG